VRVILLGRDLITASRIAETLARADGELRRVEDPAELPSPASVDLLLVDWGDRRPEWGANLAEWRTGAPQSAGPRVILFGPHADLAAHADARAAGLGPMWARSRLFAKLSNAVN
jgi:hypothetical protein